MTTVVFDHIPWQPAMEPLLKRVRLAEESDYWAEFQAFCAAAQEVARPKAMLKVAYVEAKGEDYVIVEGVRLSSRVLRVNLELAHRVLMYVATCGMELQRWAEGEMDPLRQFWAEALKEQALGAAIKTVSQHISEHYPGKTSAMNPGSLADWPLREQRPFFAIMGDVEGAIGVRLTPSCLMVPNKSVSSLRFPVEENFESCQLCPREVCPGRRAPYDPELYERKFRPRAKGG